MEIDGYWMFGWMNKLMKMDGSSKDGGMDGWVGGWMDEWM